MSESKLRPTKTHSLLRRGCRQH